jgi:hypothetical protein
MRNLSDFERRQIIGAHLAGTYLTASFTLLGVLRTAVSKM